MVDPLLIVIVGFVLFVLIDSVPKVGPLLSTLGIFFYYLWAYANLSASQSLATFYLFLAIFVLLVQVTRFVTLQNSEEQKVAGFTLKGVAVNLFGVVVGVGIFFVMRFLQSGTPAAIVGVPSLAIASATFLPLTTGYLGILENRTFFAMLEILRSDFGMKLWSGIPFLGTAILLLGLAGSVAFVAGAFTIYHLAAFNLAASSLLFAFVVFTLWLVFYIFLKDDSPANTSHFLWNSSIGLSRGLTIS